MQTDKPFLIDGTGEYFENHMEMDSDKEFVFEFSKDNMSGSFDTDDNSDSFTLLHSDMEDIKNILEDIKRLLTEKQ